MSQHLHLPHSLFRGHTHQKYMLCLYYESTWTACLERITILKGLTVVCEIFRIFWLWYQRKIYTSHFLLLFILPYLPLPHFFLTVLLNSIVLGLLYLLCFAAIYIHSIPQRAVKHTSKEAHILVTNSWWTAYSLDWREVRSRTMWGQHWN